MEGVCERQTSLQAEQKTKYIQEGGLVVLCITLMVQLQPVELVFNTNLCF